MALQPTSPVDAARVLVERPVSVQHIQSQPPSPPVPQTVEGKPALREERRRPAKKFERRSQQRRQHRAVVALDRRVGARRAEDDSETLRGQNIDLKA